jgi:hypothetical protein
MSGSSVVEYYDQVKSSGAGQGWQAFFNLGGLNGAWSAADAPDGLRIGEDGPDNQGLIQGFFLNGGFFTALDAPLGTANLLRNGLKKGNQAADNFMSEDMFAFVNLGGNGGETTSDEASGSYVFKAGGNPAGGPADHKLTGLHAADDYITTAWLYDGGFHGPIDDSLPMSDTHPNGMNWYNLPASELEDGHSLLLGGAPAASASSSAYDEIAGENSGIKKAGNDDDNMSERGAPIPLVLSPEPSSIALACLGAATLLIARRK